MSTTRYISLFLLAAALFWVKSAIGAQQLQLEAKQKHYKIGTYLDILIDSTRSIQYEDLKEPSVKRQFDPCSEESPNFGFRQAWYWLKFRYNDSSPPDLKWLLSIDYPLLDSVDIYFLSDKGYYIKKSAGDNYEFSAREIKMPAFAFSLPYLKEEFHTVYIHVRSDGSNNFPISVVEEQEFFYQARLRDILQAIYAGIFLVMIAYNLFLYASLREESFLYYSLFISGFLLMQMTLKGYAYEFLWPNNPRFANVSHLFAIAFSSIFANHFTVSFLNIKSFYKRLFYLARAIDILAFVYIGAVFVTMAIPTWYNTVTVLAPVIGLVSTALMFTSAIMVMRKGYRPAYFYSVAWAIFLVGICIYSLKFSGLVPHNIFTDNIIQIGSVLQIIFLSLGLADRVKRAEFERNLAQNEMIETLKEKEIFVSQQNAVLEARVVERTTELVAINQEITASINYARLIQAAILPSKEEIKKDLPNSFIIHQPRDIVSGDFYFFKRLGDRVVIAAVDCTGHGVPGGFMSMIGNDLLHEIIEFKKIVNPAEILKELNEGINRTLKQDSSGNTDGMDVALCVYSAKENLLEFAGSCLSAFCVINNELTELKGDKLTIGGINDSKDTRVYRLQQHKVTEPMWVYLTSDGIEDQFGGLKGKKFMRHRLKKMLLDISSLTSEQQTKAVISTMNTWIGHEEQVDDIMLIGFKLEPQS